MLAAGRSSSSLDDVQLAVGRIWSHDPAAAVHNKVHIYINTLVSSDISSISLDLVRPVVNRERDDDDDAIWIPPADEAAADMMAAAAAADEYATATRDEEEEESHDRRAEERQKAMVRAMNGQLKMLAARFLESAGGIPAGWLDIVTSLSWEAALVIRPDDGASGNDMDPSSYVKVKCLASGTRRQR